MPLEGKRGTNPAGAAASEMGSKPKARLTASRAARRPVGVRFAGPAGWREVMGATGVMACGRTGGVEYEVSWINLAGV